MSDIRDLALRALVTKCVADVAASAIKQRREDLAAAMVNGDRSNVTDPEDPSVDLGHVLRTKPKGSGVITDREAFTEWMAVNYQDRVRDRTSFVEADRAAVNTVLAEHAPHLLKVDSVVMEWAENEVLLLTAKHRQPCGPSGELDVPGVAYEPPKPGVVTVKPSEEAPAVIAEMWRQGRIDLTTGEVLALESTP